MRILSLVIMVAGLFAITTHQTQATEVVIKHTVACEVPDIDPTLVKVFQIKRAVKTVEECVNVTSHGAHLEDKFLGINHLVVPKGKAISFVPKPGIWVAGEDKTWCTFIQVMNRGQIARISVRILPAKSDCDNPPQGSFFLREFRMERDPHGGQMLLKQVCLLPSKHDICINSSQMTDTGRYNAVWLLDEVIIRIKRYEPARIAQFF